MIARFLFALCAIGIGCGGEAPAPRHLILISVDTLRADHLGCYGSPLGLTPNIDRLAEASQVFATAYAPAPITLPSLAALLRLGLESTLPGRNLLEAGGSGSPAYFVAATDSLSSAQRVGIVSGGYKLVRTGEKFAPRERLYRLPDENRNVAGSEPEVARALQTELNGLLAQLRSGRLPVRRTLPTEQRARLEALVYVTD